MSLIMCVMTLALVGCENKLEIGNNDSNNNGIESEVVSCSINGHEYVDLGLSVKWATCNVGANKPHEYGNYYVSDKTSTMSDIPKKNSRTYGENIFDINYDRDYDVATANWGGSWRIPTKREMKELENNCSWTWTSQRGVNGYRVTGPNGNSIFLPTAGYLSIDVGEYDKSEFYPTESNTSYTCGLYFGSGDRFTYWIYRYSGQTVRPVLSRINA